MTVEKCLMASHVSLLSGMSRSQYISPSAKHVLDILMTVHSIYIHQSLSENGGTKDDEEMTFSGARFYQWRLTDKHFYGIPRGPANRMKSNSEHKVIHANDFMGNYKTNFYNRN